jgi:hypothetical protein
LFHYDALDDPGAEAGGEKKSRDHPMHAHTPFLLMTGGAWRSWR